MNDKDSALKSIIELRESIKSDLTKIDSLLQIYFPSEYEYAYQHWMPQVLTALYNDLKWLPRGEATLQDSIDRIKDVSDNAGGVSKFIK